MIYSQLLLGYGPLADVVKLRSIRFLCDSSAGRKITPTMMMAARSIQTAGLEYVNCGTRAAAADLDGNRGDRPATATYQWDCWGDAVYASEYITLKKGDRWVIVSVVWTEAADKNDDFFGFDRLQASLGDIPEFEEIFGSRSTRFCRRKRR